MERTTFIGTQIPKEVKLLPQLLKDLNKSIFSSVVSMILASIDGSDIHNKSLLQNEDKVLHLDALISGLYILITRSLRIPLSAGKQETFIEDLNELKIPSQFIPDLTKLIYGTKRQALEEKILTLQPHHPKLSRLQWRIDVSISTSVLNRALQPSILMKIILDTGKIYVFEIPITKFHMLRCNVATALKEMEDLEKRNVFKIQD